MIWFTIIFLLDLWRCSMFLKGTEDIPTHTKKAYIARLVIDVLLIAVIAIKTLH